MADSFQFDQSTPFLASEALEILRGVPELSGVFAVCGAQSSDQPYITRTANLKRRLQRLLLPGDVQDASKPQSRRLDLRERIARIEWTVTGSEFESLLVLYSATSEQFGYPEARKRLRLHTPYVLRLTMENRHPRVYVTNRLSKRGLNMMYGPFLSRVAAERYCDAVLDLFKLRRCSEDLEVSPNHPGCAYGEMKKCLAPCNLSCTAEDYAAEATQVRAFFDTHGESLLGSISAEREKASAEMEFERAAVLHEQWQRVKNAASLADDLVRPIPMLRALVVQRTAERREKDAPDAQEAAVFLMQGGCWSGPERLSTLGVRAVQEQTSVGSSLFAQPLMLQAVPLESEPLRAAESPEERAKAVLTRLEEKSMPASDLALLSDHLSLFRRWYYKPEKQRGGEVFLPNADGSWPIRRILRGAARAVLGDPKPMAETQREEAKALRTRMLHEGRPGIEREVPILPKQVEHSPAFTSRRKANS